MDWLRRRRVGVALHWATALFALGTAVASDPGTSRALGALFAAAGLAFAGRAALVGPMARPGPRLRGAARVVHLGLHRGLLVVVVAVILTGLASGMAGPGVAGAIGRNTGAMALWHDRLFNGLFAVAAGHIAFNLWRGAALGERPISAMLPRL
jgi:cytochrome b561